MNEIIPKLSKIGFSNFSAEELDHIFKTAMIHHYHVFLANDLDEGDTSMSLKYIEAFATRHGADELIYAAKTKASGFSEVIGSDSTLEAIEIRPREGRSSKTSVRNSWDLALTLKKRQKAIESLKANKAHKITNKLASSN